MNRFLNYEPCEDFPNPVQISAYKGLACWIVGDQTEPDQDTEWTGIETKTGRLVARMVGDDHLFICDPEDISTLDDSDFCSECGQVGCGWC